MPNISTKSRLLSSENRRCASASIAGYLYQFLVSLDRLISLDDNETLTIEGIEDIDIEGASTNLVQVKYYESTSYSCARITNTVKEFYLDYIKRQPDTQTHYTFYVYFKSGGQKLISPESRSDVIRKCLQKAGILERDSISDTELKRFVQLIDVIPGRNLAELQRMVIEAIKKEMECTQAEAEGFYYPKALEFVHRAAIERKKEDRKIQRRKFLHFLRENQSLSDPLFSAWRRKVLSTEAHIEVITKKLGENIFKEHTRQRLLMIEINDRNYADVAAIAHSLVNVIASPGRTKAANARPWTLLLRGDKEKVRNLKMQLTKNNITFNDGQEAYGFSSNVFLTPPMYQTGPGGSKMVGISYTLRIISESSFDKLPKDKIDEMYTISLVPDYALLERLPARNLFSYPPESVGELRIAIERNL